MAPLGRLGIGVRGADHPGFWNEDQLYNARLDPKETRNLADNPDYASTLEAMRATLTARLETLDRPFGEFVPGGNAAEPGRVESQ